MVLTCCLQPKLAINNTCNLSFSRFSSAHHTPPHPTTPHHTTPHHTTPHHTTPHHTTPHHTTPHHTTPHHTPPHHTTPHPTTPHHTTGFTSAPFAYQALVVCHAVLTPATTHLPPCCAGRCHEAARGVLYKQRPGVPYSLLRGQG